mmetsp:Transcript_12861/g.24430  ORF Transcript_12861/g.24430 Transcript_12861/m.24430 type:complete len:240 (+) Transcript_12861:231-950(+)|eukprot:scaffold5314_cov167-Amphora_coffeaeformis.AAC.4
MQGQTLIKMKPWVILMSALLLLSFLLSTSRAFVSTTTQSIHQRHNSAVCRRRNVVDQQQRLVTPTTTTPLFLFDGIFSTVEKNKDDLALYKNVGSGSTKYASLAEYVEQWAKFFETDNKKLTTPVKVRSLSSETQQQQQQEPNVVIRRGVEIVFQNVPNRGYTDKDATKEDKNKTDKKKDKRNVKQGGVAILVEQLKDDTVQVRAKRCEMDDDTMIKEMSEEAILQELKKAIAVWKKGA